MLKLLLVCQPLSCLCSGSCPVQQKREALQAELEEVVYSACGFIVEKLVCFDGVEHFACEVDEGGWRDVCGEEG